MGSRKRLGRGDSHRPGDGAHRPTAADEAALWHEVVKDVTPLNLRSAANTTSANKKPKGPTLSIQRKPFDLSALKIGSSSSTLPAFEHGKAPGLDRKTQSRMRRGKVKTEGRLDLHGMTQAQAHHALLNFIEAAYFDGRGSVLVITGKGLTLRGEVGVLRRAVPKWLNQAPISGWIKGFDYAARQHGGEGALYVLIRRKR